MDSRIHSTSRVGFAGVGRMGGNMARHLKEVGFAVTQVFDVHPDRAEALAAELDCEAATTLAAVTAGADVILTVVPDDSAMLHIFQPGGDSLLTAAEGKLFINCATVSPAIHIQVEQLAEDAGAHSLEACMASSIPQARDGSLYLMCAGREEVYRWCQPVLAAMSSSMRYVGKAGEAAKVKALVNMVMNINTAGLAEGLALGDALGLDLTTLREILSETGGNSRVLQTDGEDMQNHDHSCFFSAAHAAKDSGIALRLGETAGLDLPLAAATKKQFDRMVAEGLGELDKSGIATLTFPRPSK
jgi:3-hydroxyisobutyrate dehydrogenase